MLDDARARLGKAAALAAAASPFLPILALCSTRATDTDLWWHLASGDLIRRTGTIPRSEPFSFTSFGHPWIDIHWLFQVVLSSLYELGGLRLLEGMRAIVILGVFAVVFRRCRRTAGLAIAMAVVLLATLACQERFLTRPEIVSWGFMLIVLACLGRALEAPQRSRRAVFLFVLIPLTQLVWVNVQGLFVLGPVFIALGFLAASFEFVRAHSAGRRGVPAPEAWRDPDRMVDLFVALAVVALVSLLNPYGAGALRLPFEQFFVHLGGRSLLSRTIAEFQPPLSGYLVTPSILAFVLLAAITLLVLLADLPRVRAFDLLVTLATLVVALRARRNIPIFALAAAPVLARHAAAVIGQILASAPFARIEASVEKAGGWLGAAWRKGRAVSGVAPALLALLAVGITVDVATGRFFLRRPTERWFGSGEIPYYFPEESAAFLAGGGTPGNVFHSLAVGGYLIHAWSGERKVFIDGRNDPYLDDVLPSYLKAVADPTAFEEVVRRYQITAVLWPHQRALEGKALLSYLARGQGWVLAHLDPAAAVYLRADVLSPARIAEGPFPPGRDRGETYVGLARRLELRPFHGPPIQDISLAEFFSVSGDARGAEYFYRRALDRLPRSATVLYGYALALERQGRSPEARAAYARVIEIDPDYWPAVAAIGSYLLEEGRLQEAADPLERAYRGGERSARLLEARARLFEQNGDPSQALASYREAALASPRDTAVLRSVALFYLRRDQADAALPFYTAASEADPDDPVIAREMAGLLDRLGRTSAALDVTRDASRRAMERLSGGRMGEWARGAESREDDRRLLVLAAELETRAGDGAKASEYLGVLERAGLKGSSGP